MYNKDNATHCVIHSLFCFLYSLPFISKNSLVLVISQEVSIRE